MCSSPFCFLAGQPSQPRGFALIAVIFLMVVLSGAVLMMSRLADMQAAERTMDIMGARAQSSAKAGLQWAINQMAVACPGPGDPVTKVNPAFTMDAESDLSGFAVTVTCTRRPFIEGFDDVVLYFINSEASFSDIDSNTSEYVFRRLTAVVELDT